MRDFFKGLQRKLGVVTLGLALFLSVAWIRSFVRQDDLHTPFFSLHIHCGTVAWFGALNVGWKWHTAEINTDNWTGFAGGWGWSRDSIAVPYWSLIVPSTMLTTYLLLSKPRPAKRTEPAPTAGDSHA